MRKGSHFQPRMPKNHLVDDINELLQKITGEKDIRLMDWQHISIRDLETIIYALEIKKL